MTSQGAYPHGRGGSRSHSRVGQSFRSAARLCALLCLSCSLDPSEPVSPSTAAVLETVPVEPGDGVLLPLPRPTSRANDPRVRLGAALFFDPVLSADRAVSCGTCHNPEQGWANGQFRTALAGRYPTAVNVPSVTNMAFNFRFSWSGKFTELDDQIQAAMQLKDAMNFTFESAVQRLAQDANYREQFSTAYSDGMTAVNVRDALVRYCNSLVTPDSKFDRYLRKEVNLTKSELLGYQLFRDYGCSSCHQGVNVGGNMYQRFGIVEDYFANKKPLTQADLGLYAASKRPEDKHVFRVPSLRNVALTAPYFHDGSAATLTDAIQAMARYQLGRQLSDEQTQNIAAFLKTLTGVIPRPGGP